jgi:hypothetical protein
MWFYLKSGTADLAMQFALETVWGLGSLLLKVFLIVVPLMMLLEISRTYKILDKLIAACYPITRRIGLKRDSIYPLIAGVIFGISYGAGVLIGESDSGRIKGNQMFLVALFLGICHSILEDTLLFAAQGANGFIILGVRIPLAIIVVFFASLIIKEKSD